MAETLLLIKLPQTKIGEYFPQQVIPAETSGLSTRWNVAGYDVCFIDANAARMNCFSLMRAIRMHSPRYISIINDEMDAGSSLRPIVFTMLKLTLPNTLLMDGLISPSIAI